MAREYPLEPTTATSASWPTSTPARRRRPSASCTTPASPQDRRSPRRRRDDGLDGAGAGARHHHHVGRHHDCFWRESTASRRRPASTASTSSTPPATSTSPSKSSVRCACSTAPSCVLDSNAGVEPQTETVWRQADKYKRAAHRLRQQDGQDRRRLLRCVKMIKDRLGAKPCPIAAADRRRDELQGHHRPRDDEGMGLEGEDLGRQVRTSSDPDDLKDKAAEYRASWSSRRRAGRRRDGAYLEGKEPDDDTLRKLIRKGTLAPSSRSLRLGLQEQGRAAAARRRRRLPAVAARRPPIKGIGDETMTRDIAPSADDASRSRRWRSRS
jgi:hypothetical protein